MGKMAIFFIKPLDIFSRKQENYPIMKRGAAILDFQTPTQKMLPAFFVTDLTGNRQQATGNRQQAIITII